MVREYAHRGLDLPAIPHSAVAQVVSEAVHKGTFHVTGFN
jgi:hypothetical protein